MFHNLKILHTPIDLMSKASVRLECANLIHLFDRIDFQNNIDTASKEFRSMKVIFDLVCIWLEPETAETPHWELSVMVFRLEFVSIFAFNESELYFVLYQWIYPKILCVDCMFPAMHLSLGHCCATDALFDF